MKVCEKCKVQVVGKREHCPLCQNELILKDSCKDDVFPELPPHQDRYYLLFRVITFICITIGSISVLGNMLFTRGGWWSLIVIATLLCIWISVGNAIFKHKNIIKYLMYQSLILLIFALFLDYRTGWYRWSITYVMPITFTVDMIVMYSLSKVLKLETGDYMIYLLLDALFGIIPIIFVGSEILQTEIPSFVCIVASIVSVTALVVFEGKNMYNELKRRLHV